MRKVEVSLPVSGRWGTTCTKYPADSAFTQPDDFITGSKNHETQSNGTIRKRPGTANYANLAAVAKDQYEAIFADGVRHLLVVDANGRLTYSPGDGSITQVVTGLTNPGLWDFEMYGDRVYLGNKDVTKVYDRTTSYGGVTYTAPQLKTMGCQAPATGPTAPAAGAAGGGVPLGAHTYKVTYLYYDDEESNGSAASTVCTVVGVNQTVGLTAIPVGGYGVTARNVYRDNNDGAYLLVGTISNNTATTFSDTAAVGGVPMPLDNGVPPNFGLVTAFLDRLFMAAVPGDPFTLWFSDAAFPDIVKSLNYVVCNPTDPITGLVVYRDRLIVFNRNSMGQILGRTKSEFRYTMLEDSIGCIDNRTIAIRTLDGVPTLVWLSDLGLHSYNGNSVEYLSDKIENILNVEIQQASSARGRNSQTSQADFQAGAVQDYSTDVMQEQTSGASSWTVPIPFNMAVGDSFGVNATLTGLHARGGGATAFYSIQFKTTDNGGYLQVINIFSDGVVGNAFNVGGVAASCTGSRQFKFVMNADRTVAFYRDNVFVGNLAVGTQTYGGGPTSITFGPFGGAGGTFTRQWVINHTPIPGATGGIDLISNPGAITVPSAERLYDDDTDYNQAGVTKSNISTLDPNNLMHQPNARAFGNSEGAHSGQSQNSGVGVTLATAADFTGETLHFNYRTPTANLARAGVYSTTLVDIPAGTVVTGNNRWFTLKIRDEAGTVLYTSAEQNYGTSIAAGTLIFTPSLSRPANSRVIFSLVQRNSLFGGLTIDSYDVNFGERPTTYTYTFLQTSVASSGTWTSQAYDTYSDSVTDVTINLSGVASGSSALAVPIDGSDDGDTWLETQGASNITFVSGSYTATRTFTRAYRFYRVRIVMSSSDDRVAPVTTSNPEISFGLYSEWTSPAIDRTTDITSHVSLRMVFQSVPGFVAAFYVATSADNVTYSSYVFKDFTQVTQGDGSILVSVTAPELSSIPLDRYAKVKVKFTRSFSNGDSATLSSIVFDWATSSQLISQVINTGTVPAGWDVFQSTEAANGGTISYEMRTASSSGGLAAATWIAVSPGSFPTNAVLQYVQWRVTLTASGSSVPVVYDVTVNWLLAGGTTIRAASIFHRRTYYLSVAESGQTANNLIIAMDEDGNFRFYRGAACSTLTFFFNEMYGGVSTTAKIIKLLAGITDSGVAIELDVRSKASDFSEDGYDNSEFDKILKEVIVKLKHTGTTYSLYFSVDGGTTYVPLYNMLTNTATIVTTNTGLIKRYRFAPRFNNGATVQGKTIIIRIVSSDVYEAEIQSTKIKAWIRRGEINT